MDGCLWSCDRSYCQTLYPKVGHVPPDRWIGTVSDDQTAFQFAAEVDTGDRFLIALPLKNASGYDMVVELTIIFPDGFFVEVFGSDEEMTAVTNHTQHVTRTGLYTWKFILKKEAEKRAWDTVGYQWADNIGILVAVADDIKPGFYRIEGKLKQVAY